MHGNLQDIEPNTLFRQDKMHGFYQSLLGLTLKCLFYLCTHYSVKMEGFNLVNTRGWGRTFAGMSVVTMQAIRIHMREKFRIQYQIIGTFIPKGKVLFLLIF